MTKKFSSCYGAIDHLAIAVKDLPSAITLYENVFGFKLREQREIKGKFSGMKSAELDAGGFSIVLIQGTEPESQVTRYIKEFGSGVQHVAIRVDNLETVAKALADSGVKFATDIIKGDGLTQIFTKREENTGMMFEFIERRAVAGFEEKNIQTLFNQLEESEAY